MRLGFGCSNLGSDLDYRRSCALVETALECGFTHFDVAPPYGNGQAESILGDVLAPVRDRVTLFTKVGIAHPRAAGGLRSVKRLVSPLKRLMPGLWARASRRAREVSAPRGRFAVRDVEASLAESLRRLRVQRLDGLLLHAVEPDQIDAGLLSFLRMLKANGAAGRIGLGTDAGSAARCRAIDPVLFDVVQSDHYWTAFSGHFPSDEMLLVTHRCLLAGLPLIESADFGEILATEQDGGVLASALRDPAMRGALLISAGLKANPAGRVLVSSSKPERIRAFVAAEGDRSLDVLAEALNRCLVRFHRKYVLPGHQQVTTS